MKIVDISAAFFNPRSMETEYSIIIRNGEGEIIKSYPIKECGNLYYLFENEESKAKLLFTGSSLEDCRQYIYNILKS